MIGVFYDSRKNRVSYKYPLGISNKTFLWCSWTSIDYGTDKAIKEELATIGIKYNKDGDITENDIRLEQGFTGEI